MLSTPVSGGYVNGTAFWRGYDGYFWSSTYYDAYYMYSMVASGTTVRPQYYFARYYGNSIRCIAQ
ncbi:hypothetical protein IJI18_02140 [Candidatus Saccharibacteria bacterium]|nr:hypothetical protein [Candidatus Saccharibacteria bacterium]